MDFPFENAWRTVSWQTRFLTHFRGHPKAPWYAPASEVMPSGPPACAARAPPPRWGELASPLLARVRWEARAAGATGLCMGGEGATGASHADVSLFPRSGWPPSLGSRASRWVPPHHTCGKSIFHVMSSRTSFRQHLFPFIFSFKVQTYLRHSISRSLSFKNHFRYFEYILVSFLSPKDQK